MKLLPRSRPAKVDIVRPPAQRFRGRPCSATVGGRPRWSPELAAGLRERSRAENRAARRSQSTAERPTSTARSTCDRSGPVRPLRGLEGRTSSGWNGLKLGDRARAQCAPPRRVLLSPAHTRRDVSTNAPMRPPTRPRTVAGRANGARCTTWPRDRYGRRNGRRRRRRPAQRKGAHPQCSWARAGTRATSVDVERRCAAVRGAALHACSRQLTEPQASPAPAKNAAVWLVVSGVCCTL